MDLFVCTGEEFENRNGGFGELLYELGLLGDCSEGKLFVLFD